jgi:hypothetical protein
MISAEEIHAQNCICALKRKIPSMKVYMDTKSVGRRKRARG